MEDLSKTPIKYSRRDMEVVNMLEETSKELAQAKNDLSEYTDNLKTDIEAEMYYKLIKLFNMEKDPKIGKPVKEFVDLYESYNK